MKKFSQLLFLLGLAVGGTATAGTPFYSAKEFVVEEPCRFYIQATVGAAYGVHGDFVEEMNRDVSTLPVYAGSHTTVTTESNDLSFDDIFGAAETYGLRLGRACEGGRIYVALEFTQSAGSNVQIGGATKDGDYCPVYADFNDYSDWALLVGAERDLTRGGVFRPYVGGQLGLRFVNGVDATMSIVDPITGAPHGPVVPGVNFYENSVVFTAGMTLGLALDITERMSVGMETGLRYNTRLDEYEPELAAAGFDFSNDGDGLLMLPVLGTMAVKF
ncbi:MAG: hypothetical protein AAF191_17940 [Verrucomicrobiota bacterium]